MKEQTMVRLRDSKLTWPIQRFLEKLNLTLIPKNASFEYQLKYFIELLQIEYLLDIGAHEGEFIQKLDRLQCSLDTVAYEPSQNAVKKLSERFAGKVDIKRLAITEDGRTSELWDTGSPFASLKKRKDKLVGQNSEIVRSITLQEAAIDLGKEKWGKTLLKVDVQGSELEVLRSGGEFISSVPLVVAEASLQMFYEEASTLKDIISFMTESSFSIGSIHTPRFNNGSPLDCDIIFIRG